MVNMDVLLMAENKTLVGRSVPGYLNLAISNFQPGMWVDNT